MRRQLVVVLMLCSLLLAPAALAGGGAVLDGYGGNGSAPVVQVAGQSTEPQDASGSLPFTGADLMWFVVGGSALVAIGVGLRRLGRDRG